MAIAKYAKISATTIFIGDSHIRQAIDDKLIKNSINIAQNSESFYFSYYKLVYLLKSNPSVKKVYLGYSYHSLSSYYDQFIDGEYSNAISSRYFYLLPFKEKINLLFANKNHIFSYFLSILKKGIINIYSKRATYQGGFDNSFTNTNAKEKSIQARIFLQYYQGNYLDNFSIKNIEHLIKIRNLCKKMNINLKLINTPVYPLYKKRIPKKFIAEYKLIHEKLHIDVIDMSDLLSNENCFIPDGDHVSKKGAILTTEYLVNKIKK